MLDKKPQKSDLLRLFKSSSSHYMIIGTALNVKVDDLLPNPQSTTSNLILVFQRWMDSNKGLTWRKVLQVCEDFPEQLGQAKAEVERFLSSPSAQSLYGAESIIISSSFHFALASLILLFVAILIAYLC